LRQIVWMNYIIVLNTIYYNIFAIALFLKVSPKRRGFLQFIMLMVDLHWVSKVKRLAPTAEAIIIAESKYTNGLIEIESQTNAHNNV